MKPLAFSFLGTKNLCLSTSDTEEENGGDTLLFLHFMLHLGPITLVHVLFYKIVRFFSLNPAVVFDSVPSVTAGKEVISCCISIKYFDGLAFHRASIS